MEEIAETVQASEDIEQAIEQAQEVIENEVDSSEQQDVVEDHQEEVKVPLSALQKERKKRQEAELRAQWVEEQAKKMQVSKPEPEDDEDEYETVTKKEYKKGKEELTNEIVRKVEESTWIRHNPDKYEEIQERLPELLKRKPHLAYAIAQATNRLEEAWDLMTAFNKKDVVEKRGQPQKRVAPQSPTSVPKVTAMNHTIDVMNMSDAEFREWRQQQKRGR